MVGAGLLEGTILSELARALEEAGVYNAQDQVAPAAVLWTDKERQWESVVPQLRESLEGVLTLGEYAPEARKGPAIWLRCMLERKLPEADWPSTVVPILYLPGASRHELRAVAECPQHLQPLAELQYRGVWFTQESTKDWTVLAFLTSKRGGLELDVASDAATRDAIQPSLSKLVETPLAELQGRRLHAADFQDLLQPDLLRQLLRWLDQPKATRKNWSPEEWQAFCGACRDRFGFDPETDGELVGAEKLGGGQGAWESVWIRFAEAPDAFPNLPDLLARAKPENEDDLFFRRECWPQCNAQAETKLREELLSLGSLSAEQAAAQITDLERSHGKRREWVWARLGQAPLASALEHLSHLARSTRKKLGGEDAAAMAVTYAGEGWQADAAVLDALAAVLSSADVGAVRSASRAVYKPWLEAAAESLQDRVREKLPERYGEWPQELAHIEAGTCVLFADGLRMDVGKRLRGALEKAGYVVTESWRWVPVPPVTPTAKPLASPVADLVSGDGAGGEQFQPMVRETGQPLTIERFRTLLGGRGFQDLRGEETGDPAGRAWTEYGEIDQRGHKEGWKLARRIVEEVNGLVDRICTLLQTGWRQVQVTTDHGWLLLPGGLPKIEMPNYLVESRWTRCGTLKAGAKVEVPTAPWHWNPDVQVALAPGIGSFRANTEYSHGSLSLQECVVPAFVVRSAHPLGSVPSVEAVRWSGLRCRVQVVGASAGWQVDLRTKAGDDQSSISMSKQAKPIEPSGEVALVVDDPDLEGVAAVVVLLEPGGSVVVKRNTTVGG